MIFRPTIERAGNRLPSVRKKAIVVLSGLAIASCNNGAPIVDRQSHTVRSDPNSVDTKAVMLSEVAFRDLSDKIAKHRTVTMLVAKNVCAYWKARDGFDTVVRSPAFYIFKRGTEELTMVPFVPSAPKKLRLLDGPFSYSDPTNKVNNYGNLGALNLATDVQLFRPSTERYSLVQEAVPTPFTSAWLQADNGTRVSETELVQDIDLNRAFDGSCHFINPHSLTA